MIFTREIRPIDRLDRAGPGPDGEIALKQMTGAWGAHFRPRKKRLLASICCEKLLKGQFKGANRKREYISAGFRSACPIHHACQIRLSKPHLECP